MKFEVDSEPKMINDVRILYISDCLLMTENLAVHFYQGVYPEHFRCRIYADITSSGIHLLLLRRLHLRESAPKSLPVMATRPEIYKSFRLPSLMNRSYVYLRLLLERILTRSKRLYCLAESVTNSRPVPQLTRNGIILMTLSVLMQK